MNVKITRFIYNLSKYFNRNSLQVSDGYVWSIRERSFKLLDISKYGPLDSPRTFKTYDASSIPTAKYLEESPDNSFPDLK